MLLLLLAVSIVSFLLVEHSPIDPVKQYLVGVGGVSPEQKIEIERYWGQDEPALQRYTHWLSSFVQGEMGQSLVYRQPVKQVIGERLKSTLILMGTAWVLAGCLGSVLGCVMGLFQKRWPDRILRPICILFTSTPIYWVGMIFILLFAVKLGWFPIGFSAPIGVVQGEVTFWQKIHHLILPAITLALGSFSNVALHTREKVITVYQSDYVLFAKARGKSSGQIFWQHGLRGAIIPALILQFASFAELFGGSVLAENVFSYPGLGSAVATAGLRSDVPLLLGITICTALFVFVGNQVANLLTLLLDPTTRKKEGV